MTQTMVYQKRSDFNVASTMILRRLKAQDMLITLLCEIVRVSNHKSYIDLYCEYELRNLTNPNVGVAKDHGKNYIEVTLSLVHHV